MTLATKITFFRLLMAPVFLALALSYSLSINSGAPNQALRWTILAIFILAVASDALDGYLARRLEQQSRLGSFLDPIADKALILGATLTLTFINCGQLLPIWYTALIISREIIQISGAIAIGSIAGDIIVIHHWTGKLTTSLQIILICSAFFVETIQLIHLLTWITGFFTFISATLYIKAGLSQLPSHKHGQQNII